MGRQGRGELEEAREHIRFVISIYRIQIEGGRWFLHEHPAGATSWQMEEMKKLERATGVRINIADMCMYGMVTPKEGAKGEMAPARKRTKFMTNSYWIGAELMRKCDGRHVHQHLMGGRAKAAQVYPKGLCSAICAGLRRQLDETPQALKCLMTVTAKDSVEIGAWQPGSGRKDEGMAHEEDQDEEVRQAWDDV